ncbi:molybdopterin molybdenumtransferase MoeA [Alphaproteobacteria bacterium GH1-50]|uniref:Molybdopterin molybdenumtransferase n=1 Tax=Kangsaoukella pontilimi TaxID=2691042 RepID=A0A7C9M8W6_9RHOB|nr:gephyrin-like molybdotransferase Glp [Kangsaoukella pontilimi]MXQ06873.1 molybdopterin molybdenumtransferase MoeA [Kangsaoukella pontilimi]
MISVSEALDKVLALVTPLAPETVDLRHAAGRVLAADIVATRDQPPFAASVMDGYAVRNADVVAGAKLRVIGEAAAGHRFDGAVGQGEAVRIFTGAPVPDGADRVIIQEDVHPDGDSITLSDAMDSSMYIRPLGTDFKVGDRIAAGRRLTPADVALAASMNVPELQVARRPDVALIATGDELVMPGETPEDSQIIASNAFGLAAMLEAEGARVRLLPIAGDSAEALASAFDLAKGADLVVTIGGASVGDHDLVGQVAAGLGLDRSFYKVAMRPGKPLMAGRLGDMPMVGLPGNPVSSMVCGHIFLRPSIRVFQGLPAASMPRETARLAVPVEANGPREHYMRAALKPDGTVTVLERQDSSLLSVLASADCLVVRAPHDPAREAGDEVAIVRL